MILEYDVQRMIHVLDPGSSDVLPSVTVELQSLGAGISWAVVFAFRLRAQPNGCKTFPFRIASEHGVEAFLHEVEMEVRRLRRHIDGLDGPPVVDTPTIEWTADQIIEGFEPGHTVEIDWDGGCFLEIVFRASLARSATGQLGLSSAVGIPLLFSSPAIVPAFVAQFHAALSRVLFAIQYRTIIPPTS